MTVEKILKISCHTFISLAIILLTALPPNRTTEAKQHREVYLIEPEIP